jgi:hypothetical protein
MLTTTLNRIRIHRPCKKRWEVLLRGLNKTQADDEPLAYVDILNILGLDDTLWCCRAEPQYEKEWRLFAVGCAQQVQPLITDKRSLRELDVAERFALGATTLGELVAAGATGAATRTATGAAAWKAARAAQAKKFREVCVSNHPRSDCKKRLIAQNPQTWALVAMGIKKVKIIRLFP